MNLLSDTLIAQLNKMELTAKQIVEGFLVGLHKSPYHGFSVEFADHRQYNPGESLRNVDWKIVAKTERYYVKRYEEETNLRAYILLDHSKSMFFESKYGSKIDYAKQLAAALSWLMIQQKDAAGLITFNQRISSLLPPKAYRSYTAQIFTELLKLKAEEKTDILAPLHQIAEGIKKRSLIVLISDLLEEPERIISALKHFRSQRHEVLVFQLYDPREEELDYRRETEFIDSESGEKVIINPWQIREEYQLQFNSFFRELKNACHQYQIEYQPVSLAEPIEKLLFKYLSVRRKGL